MRNPHLKIFAIPLMALISGVPFATAQESAAPQSRAGISRQRQEEFYRVRAYPGNQIPAGARAAAVAEMERMVAREKQSAKLSGRAASSNSWTLIGPRPVNANPLGGNSTNGGSGPPFASGRVAALANDPRNPNVVYVGASGGGVWKTTDGGQNWTPIADDQPSLAIGSIALAPSNPDIVYVGTGEQNNSGDSYYGAGILKSTNGGATWTQLAGPFVGPFNSSRVTGGGARIGSVAVHPSNPNIVLAAVDRASIATSGPTASGIFRSTDGGTTWTNVLGGAVGTEVVFDPSNPNQVYAALGSAGGSIRNGVYKSTDGGVTWNLSSGTGVNLFPTVNVGRIALAIAPSSPNILYAGIQSTSASAGGGLLGMYKTTDGGQNWSRVFSPDYCLPQCSYDNVIRVHPTNPNIVVAAGLPAYRSFDGGLSWFDLAAGSNGGFAHTDHHALAFTSDGARLYVGNDGGVYSTTNLSPIPAAWADLNTTLAITEFSSNVSIDPSDPNVAYAGTQDNGTLVYRGSLGWDQAVGGDGGWTAIDTALPSIWYGSFFGIQPYKLSGVTSLENFYPILGAYYPIQVNGIDRTDRALFYVPIQMDPSNPQRLYYGTFRVYQSNDGAGTWTAISPALTATAQTGAVAVMTVSPSLPRVVYVGTTDGKVQVTNTADQGKGAQWVDRSTGLPGRSISRIVADPLDPTIFYVTLSGFSGFIPNDNAGHVFKTIDFGQTYTDISGDLPNIPVNDLVIDPDLPNTLYIATDIGVFQSIDTGQIWSTLSTGLPRVLVQSLNLHRASRTLRAVTYGRSMWDLSLPLAGPSLAPHIASVAPASPTVGAGATITLTGSNFIASSVVRWNGQDRTAALVNGTTLKVTLTAADLAGAGRNTILVFNPVAGGGLSNSVNVPVGPAPAFTSGGITSAANPLASPLVAGSISAVYGTNLAASTTVAAAAPLPPTLGGVTVEINSIPAPLFFVSPTQINFQVPWDLEGFDRATVTIINGTLVSATLSANVVESFPTLFSTNGRGTGQGAILIGVQAAPVAAPLGAFPNSRPAQHGEFLQIYATGMGLVSRIPFNGNALSVPSITRTPVVNIGGVPANVTFSGLAPGAVGLFQINAQVPDGAASGDAVPVTVSLGGVTSNVVTVAIAP